MCSNTTKTFKRKLFPNETYYFRNTKYVFEHI